jgi:iron(III) transport system substrate-binding protein
MIARPSRTASLGGLAALLTATLLQTVPAAAAEVVNVYTTREPGLIKPLFDAFTKKTGIEVKPIFVNAGLTERVAAEGAKSPADILMTVDYGNLLDLVEKGQTQPIKSAVLDEAIPVNLRDPNGHWYTLSMRARVIYVSKDRVKEETLTYEDLADPKWKGKICIRSGQHPYNTSLIAAVIAKDGPEKAAEWLKGVKANLARKAAGGDRDGARDILAGICDVAVGNSYYVGLMRGGAGGEEQKRWGDAIRVVLPTFADKKGTHVNVSGAAIARNAPNKDNAVKLLEFLVSDEAQAIYAKANYEYPVKKGAPVDPIIAALGELTVDPLPLQQLTAHRKEASQLVDKVGFDN